jgi:hypothetical protein
VNWLHRGDHIQPRKPGYITGVQQLDVFDPVA